MEYYKFDPWGEERGDLRTALSTANLYNVVVAAAGGKKFRQVSEFMIDYEEVNRKVGAGVEGVSKRGRDSSKSLSPDRWKSIKADLKKVVTTSRRID